MSAPTSPSPADRFALIIAGLCRAVAARGARERSGGPLCALVWSWLRRLAVRVGALATRPGVGARPAAPAGRPASPRPPAAPRARPPRPSRRSPRRLPQGFAWLVRLVPEAAPAASQLQYLLAEPEMAALIDACPQMGRLLRPLCRMLGVRLPPRLCAPPPGPPAAAGHAPPPAAPGDRSPHPPPAALAPGRARRLPARRLPALA